MSKCTICGAKESLDQPQAGTHGYTTVYDCSTKIDKAFGYPDYNEFAQRCDEPVKLTNKEILYNMLYSEKKDSKMKIIYAQEPVQIVGKSIFLAGPTPRSADVPSWRPNVLSTLETIKFEGTILVPEMRNGWGTDFEYGDQINWEHESLEKADIILFWIPRNLKDMPAFTTNIEFGYWLAKNPEKIMLGYPEGAEKMAYIQFTCDKEQIPVFSNLNDLIIASLQKLYNNGL